jgi:hypothetical protein
MTQRWCRLIFVMFINMSEEDTIYKLAQRSNTLAEGMFFMSMAFDVGNSPFL